MKLFRLERHRLLTLTLLICLHFQNLNFCFSLNDEGFSLMRFRDGVVNDPFGALTTWNNDLGATNPCSWFGVGCSKGHVISLCFRDEDSRADRQPEFTQLDMELAFTPLEDMLSLNEDLIRKVCLDIKGVELQNPFPRLTYAETMSLYGSDRPDTRFDLQLKDKMMTTKVLAEVEKIKSRNENELNHSH